MVLIAAPKLSKIIAIKVPNANVGEFGIVRNLTRGGQLSDKVAGTNREVIFNPATTLQWQEKDLIQAEVRGRIQGAVQETIQTGGTKITIDASTDTTTPGVSL